MVNQEVADAPSVWNGLVNPELDPGNFENGSQTVKDHPSTRRRLLPADDEVAYAKVLLDGKDWARCLSVGRLGGSRVIACLIDGQGR